MTKISGLFASAKHKLALDIHVFSMLLLRGWSIVAGIVSLVMIPMFFNKVEQGYYFTFTSILALQTFFELGLNVVLSQVVASEMSKLHWSDGGTLSGDESVLQRLGSLVGTVSRLYRVMAMLFFLAVGTGGMYFFTVNSQGETSSGWLISWWLLMLFTAGNLYFSPLLAITEGVGKVAQVARLRTVQSLIGYIAAWSAMAAGFGLLAIPFISGSLLVGSWFWLMHDGRFLRTLERNAPLGDPLVSRIDWRVEILPFQWRVVVSWLSMYFIYQLFNPYIFSHYGAAEAGKVGLGLVVFGSLMGLSLSWIGAKTPEIAKLIGASEKARARELFKKQFIVSGFINAILCGTIVLLVQVGNMFHFPKMDRFPDVYIVSCLAVATMANHVVYSFASYMRAHKVDPMLPPFLVTGVAMAAVILLWGDRGVQLMMTLYASVLVILTVPWVLRLFLVRFWRA